MISCPKSVDYCRIIKRQFQPGAKFDTAIVLTDQEQGGGKSSMCRLLAIRDEWYCSLRNVDDQKAVVETLTGHIVCELEELEGLVLAKSIEGVRSFLSRSTDVYREPYAKHPKDIYRQSICIGTSNDPSCLPSDRSGNRRFLPIRCDKYKAEQHPLFDEKATRHDIEQCYAEAMALYKSNTENLPVKLPSEWERKLPAMQKDFLPEDNKAIRIEQWLIDNQREADPDKKHTAFCVAMIYKEALENMNKVPKQWESKEIAIILDKLKYPDGTKLLKRYEGSGGVKRIKEYGRCKAWIIADTDKMQAVIKNIEDEEDEAEPVNTKTNSGDTDGAGEQFMKVPEGDGEGIPFLN